MKLLIYGARSLALGAYLAIRKLYPEYPIEGFLVTSCHNDPPVLAKKPVWEVSQFAQMASGENMSQFHILIATPENTHSEIIATLQAYGIRSYTCLDSAKESRLMERYFGSEGLFRSLHHVQPGDERAKLCAFSAMFYKDEQLQGQYITPEWVKPLQVGAALTKQRIAGLTDHTGRNISYKNSNYCELTGLYWIWNNALSISDAEYYGLFHYRRFLDISEEDLYRIEAADVDVILPFPTIHEPNSLEHHTRYISESDWASMEHALSELAPEYMRALPVIFQKAYLYNYNILLAKKKVLADYCDWLFPILERVEELSDPKGRERNDRYIGYLGENLLTLYFMYNQDRFHIYHTGRIMLT